LDTKLDFEVLELIQNSGYSRIPVYEHSLHNVVGLLVVKVCVVLRSILFLASFRFSSFLVISLV
jgi:CBS domain containing-hemolysin-like protein